MNILITNDDGIFSEGLLALANVLSKNNNVYIYAPDSNRSGASHSASFHKDFTAIKVDFYGYYAYKLSGTPVDCVRFGLHYAPCKIDLVCAGINHGANLGGDVIYSGTVNACIEANMANIPAIAFSNTAFDNFKFDQTVKIIEHYFDKFLNLTCNDYTLNVNIPNVNVNEIKGVKICDVGNNRYADRYVKSDENTYRLIGEMLKPDSADQTDVYYSINNFVTVTPIVHISTDNNLINKYKDYKF